MYVYINIYIICMYTHTHTHTHTHIKAANAVDTDRPAQVFREERGLSIPKPVSILNQTSIVRFYQKRPNIVSKET